MLQNLRIQNFAIIDQLTIDFSDGMTVLTGETGAGKSIIIDAVGLLAGGRGSTSYIRYGEKQFRLTGLFYVPDFSATGKALLEQWQIPFENDELLVSRQLEQSGRNTIKVNDVALTVSQLKELGRELVDIHGQNEHQTLMDPKTHRQFLDAYGGEALAQALTDYRAVYDQYRALEQEVERLSVNDQEKEQRIDLLTFQINEITATALSVGEEEQLRAERTQLKNYEKIRQAFDTALATLRDGTSNSYDALGTAVSALGEIEALDESYQRFSEQAQSLYYGVEGLASDLNQAAQQLSFDPTTLNAIEERLAVIQRLKRKYGDDEAAILAYADRAQQELDALTHQEERYDDLSEKLTTCKQQLKKAAITVHRLRKETAERLNQAVDQELSELYMQHAHFRVHFDEARHFQPTGKDDIVFYLSTNAGEPFQPLHQIASGGELSRIMLAMKTIFKTQGVAMIFDEVDTGVSGRVAQAIATKMYRIALERQVLCITHLPQVAAMADQQLLVAKQTTDGRTQTSVQPLSEEGRVEQLAGMQSGETVSDTTRAAARDQLSAAAKERTQWREDVK